MRKKEIHSSNYADHQAAWEQLPWYVNGTLEREGLAEVERHVANCVACRTEVNYLRQLGSLLHASEDLPLSPGASMPALLARIASSQVGQASSAEGPPPGLRRRNWPNPLRQAAPWVRAALLAQAAAILLLIGLLAAPSDRESLREYRTLSAAGSEAEDSRTRINLVFAPDTTESQIRELVGSVEGEIVAGPTTLGVYTIATSISHLASHSEEVLLESLRARPEVVFAELAAY